MPQKKIKASDVIGNSYYIYTLTSSNNTPSLNGSINITCKVTDVYGQNVTGKSITLYQNSTSQGAKTTDSNGNASWNNISMTSAGLQVFRVENSKIEVFVDNKSDVGHTHSGYVSATKVTSWQSTPSDSNVPSEKLVKDSLDGKANSTHNHTVSNITDFPSTMTPSSHTHGNLQNNGQVGSTAQANKNVVTDSSGKITTEDKPTVPSASSTTPSADTTNGSVGTGTTWARSNHTHPKSSLYAESTHTHTVSNISDFPSIPSSSSDLSDGSDLIKKSSTSGLIKNNGTIDTNSYLTTGSASSTYQPKLTSGTNIKTINNESLLGSGNITIQGGSSVDIVTAWESTPSDSKVASEKLVKDTLDTKANSSSLSTVATSGSYSDLSNKPSIPSSSSDLGDGSDLVKKSNTSGLLKNDGTVDTTSYSTFSGSYNDLDDKPSIPSASTSKGLADDPYNGLVGTSTKYAREDHAHGKLYHWSTGGVSTATYVDLLEFTMTRSWQDIPISFVLGKRARDRPYYVNIKFSNTNITSSIYTVDSFKVWGGDETALLLYLRKVEDNKYRLCAYKVANDVYYINDIVNFNTGITITKIASADGNYGTTAPTGSAPNLYVSTYAGVCDTELTWNGGYTSNNVSPLTMAMGDDFSANRLAYFPSTRMSVEYSTDGGSTWSNYSSIGAENKQRMTVLAPNTVTAYLGNNSSTDRTKNQLRITFDFGDIGSDSVLYMITRKLAMYTATNNSTGFTCQVQTQTYAQYNTNVNTFSNVGGAMTLGGNAGWNTRPLNITLGGYASQTSSTATRIKALRLLFVQTGGTGNANVKGIRLYGETAYVTPSKYAQNGHIYSTDVNQNAVFPSKIIKEGGTSSQFLMANGDVSDDEDILNMIDTALGHMINNWEDYE